MLLDASCNQDCVGLHDHPHLPLFAMVANPANGAVSISGAKFSTAHSNGYVPHAHAITLQHPTWSCELQKKAAYKNAFAGLHELKQEEEHLQV